MEAACHRDTWASSWRVLEPELPAGRHKATLSRKKQNRQEMPSQAPSSEACTCQVPALKGEPGKRRVSSARACSSPALSHRASEGHSSPGLAWGRFHHSW